MRTVWKGRGGKHDEKEGRRKKGESSGPILLLLNKNKVSPTMSSGISTYIQQGAFMHSGPKRNKEAGHLVALSSFVKNALRDTSRISSVLDFISLCATSEKFNAQNRTLHNTWQRNPVASCVIIIIPEKQSFGRHLCSVLCSESSLSDGPVSKKSIYLSVPRGHWRCSMRWTFTKHEISGASSERRYTFLILHFFSNDKHLNKWVEKKLLGNEHGNV